MGKFLERPRHQGIVAVQKEAKAILKTAREQWLERERVLRERPENRFQWEEARRQYDESGLSGILKEVKDLRGAESLYEDSGSFDENFSDENVGRPYFYAELVINRTRKYHETFYQGGHSDQITTEYVGIQTDKDGTISFYGKRHPFDREGGIVTKIPRIKWEKNREVLENALGKVYTHPILFKDNEIIGSPFFDAWKARGGDLGALGETLKNYKPRIPPNF